MLWGNGCRKYHVRWTNHDRLPLIVEFIGIVLLYFHVGKSLEEAAFISQVVTQSEKSINTSSKTYIQAIHVILWLTVQLGINYRRYNGVYPSGRDTTITSSRGEAK